SIAGNYLTNKSLIVDWDLMDQYITKFNEAKERYQLADNLSLSSIISNEELFTIQETKTETDSFKSLLLKSVESAAKQVNENRKSEGAFLLEDIMKRISLMDDVVKSLESRKENAFR